MAEKEKTSTEGRHLRMHVYFTRGGKNSSLG